MQNTANAEIEKAYRYCERQARLHYENFPVASIIIPKKIRRPITVIYTFARHADDIADEGDFSAEDRLQQLQSYWNDLEAIRDGKTPIHPIFIALQDVLKHHPTLPIQLFFDLLTAFKQDITKHTYQDFDEIIHYCRYSANPVGRLLLHLTDNDTPINLKNSDAICSALQLINFLQDLSSDVKDRNRCYLPQTEMDQSGIALADLKNQTVTPAIETLIADQLTRAEHLLTLGSPLAKDLSGRFGFEIRLIIAGGKAMVQALHNRHSVYARPHIKVWQWPGILCKAFS